MYVATECSVTSRVHDRRVRGEPKILGVFEHGKSRGVVIELSAIEASSKERPTSTLVVGSEIADTPREVHDISIHLINRLSAHGPMVTKQNREAWILHVNQDDSVAVAHRSRKVVPSNRG